MKPQTRQKLRPLLFYGLMQLPGLALLALVLWGLLDYEQISKRTASLIYLAWLIKDIVLFPFVRRAYDSGEVPDSGPRGLIGENGTVTVALAPRGFVRVRGELWQAQLSQASDPQTQLTPGTTVRIVAAEGMLLMAEATVDSSAE